MKNAARCGVCQGRLGKDLCAECYRSGLDSYKFDLIRILMSHNTSSLLTIALLSFSYLNHSETWSQGVICKIQCSVVERVEIVGIRNSLDGWVYGPIKRFRWMDQSDCSVQNSLRHRYWWLGTNWKYEMWRRSTIHRLEELKSSPDSLAINLYALPSTP